MEQIELRPKDEAKTAAKYVILDSSAGECAYVVATKDSVPRNGVQDLRYPFPVVAVAADSAARLFAWTEEKTRINARLKMKARFDPHAVSTNVIVELPGRTHPERVVIVTSHHGLGPDHAGFVEEGIPAVSIGGGGLSGTSHKGSSGDLDTIDRVSAEILSMKASIGERILRDVGN